MDIEEIRRRIEETRKGLVPRSTSHQALTELLYAIDVESAVADEDDPPVDVDDGFVILPMPRYEALREAEEHLQETRFEPTDGEPERPEPGPTAGEPRFHPVLVKHLHDLQAEIDAIKDRLDEGCGEFRKLNGRFDNFHDRISALIGRMNKLEAMTLLIGPLRDADRERVEARTTRLLEELRRGAGTPIP